MSAPPLEGLRIVDLTMGWAGPLGTMLFADFGAEVIKVEGPGRMDWWRGGSVSQPNPDMSDLEERRWEQSPVFCGVNRNKLELVVDLKRDEGRAVFERLVAVSDVVVESFSPRVLPGLGLGYERLREINERIILMSLPAVGSTGPWAHYVGYASTTEAMAGLPALCGHDGGGPILQTPSIADPFAGLNGAVALALALYERERTGEGQRIEVPHLECAVPLIGEALMDFVLNGRIRERHANGDPTLVPNGCYPCLGDDRWVVVCVHTDEEWSRLCAAMGSAELAADPRLENAAGRVEHRAEVDDAVAAWTSARTPHEAMETLQAAGVVAAAVNNEADLLSDPQVAATGGFVDIDRSYAGVHPYPGVTVKMSATPGGIRRPAPLFGEHNTYVLRDVIGLTDEEIEALRAEGVIADVPSESGRARLSAFSGQLTRHAPLSETAHGGDPEAR
jgi:crotonobetainyl-CoA:carnitine CoA-transferase CaiB-like acyl-CoA transferase